MTELVLLCIIESSRSGGILDIFPCILLPQEISAGANATDMALIFGFIAFWLAYILSLGAPVLHAPLLFLSSSQ
jgi:hypothetical protein